MFVTIVLMSLINKKVLMSGTDYFDDGFAINAHMDDKVPVNLAVAAQEHAAIADCMRQAGVEVETVTAPPHCQDGVYTANWALIHKNIAIMANLPNIRKNEEPYAALTLRNMGYDIVHLPKNIHFSGQGDALPCGDYLFIGTTYRTRAEAHALIEHHTGLHVIGLQTVPQTHSDGSIVINKVTGWPDSFFYDLDLALAVINPGCIAWCPEAFTPESQAIIRSIADIEKIEVSLQEAMYGFACNLVSTGESVIMSGQAPQLQQTLQERGLKVYTPQVTELLKGGGFIRCTTLSL